MKARVRTLGHMLFAPVHKRPTEPVSWYRTFWGVQTIIVTLVTIVLGVRIVEVNLLELVSRDNLRAAGGLFLQVANPDWGILPEALVKIVETILIAFMATLIAVPVA